MTAPVTVTTADYALLQALDVAASADALLIAAFHRQQAASASNAQIAELREALADCLITLEHTRAFMLKKHGTTNPAREIAIDTARALLARAKSASEAEGV